MILKSVITRLVVRTAAATALIFVPGVAALHAQGDASISGVVRDGSGAAVEGAVVQVGNQETGMQRDLRTDSTGRFNAPSLAVGTYELTVDKPGFRSARRSGIVLVVGQREELELTLQIGDVRQSVEVTADPDTIATTTEDTSGLVGERQVKDLPLNGRSFDQLLTLNPGAINYTSQRAGGTGTSNSEPGNMFSVSGHRPQENLFLLNGVEYTGASEISNTPGGVSGQLLGVDAVREFAVLKDVYGAEYGKRPGAQVNIVTASGTNQLHGSLYEFVRNSAMDARNFFDLPQIPDFQRNDFGGSLGGPIRPDKTFLFGNYEGYRQNLGLSDVTLVPDNSSRASAVPSVQPLLALWPVANGPEIRTSTGAASGIATAYSSPQQTIREDFGTARLDQIFSNKDSFAGIYTVDDSQAHSPTANPYTFDDIFLRAQVASLSETHVFSSSLVNKAVFGYSRGVFYFNSGTTVDLPGWVHTGLPVGAVVVGGGTTLNGASQITNGGTNAGSNLRAARNLFTWSDQLSYARGRHTFSVGGWVQRIQSNDSLVQDQYGQVSFTNLQTFLQGQVSTYTYAPSFTPLGWRSTEAAGFAQDTIKVKPNLELQLGFRAESTSGWNEAHGRASNYAFNSNGVILTEPVIGSSALAVNNAKFLPAPRAAIAWSPLGSQKTVIRAGFGTYYALLDNLSYRLDQNGPYNTVYAVKSIPFSSISPDATYAKSKVLPSGVQPNLQTPTVESWSLKVERQLVANTTISVGYVGSHGYHELLSLDANLPTPTICPNSPCPAGYPAGELYFPPGAALANNNVWNTTHWFSEGISSYNGVEVDVNHHWQNGLQVRGVYTFSKSLDDGDNLNTSVATNSPAFLSDPLRPTADYGRASFDVRHSGVIQGTYDLPVGRPGSLLGESWGKWLLSNWQVSSIVTLQSGLPFTPQLSYNPSNDGDTRNPVRPSWNPKFSGNVILGGPNEYFNPLAFLQPLPGTYGNAGRNILQGPSLAEWDFALAKRWPLSERVNLQFRSEFFNILNHTNLNTPNPVVYAAATGGPSPTAGVITSTATTSRQIQLGLKLLW
ncbi:MAG TPA: carboxypeptidase-like regulatory domain-containing protein [Candidatus Eremiobacteraceae bacterium]|nr:carboxypeptidase-like regulatory domain-containing protein [Candidatus Eremiobacteraceae bacterium]